jgi:TRAP-type C4-dicarboxylate transport system permease small subunit
MMLLIVVNFFDYLQRFIAGNSFSWVMDITLLAGSWVFCLGFSVVVKRKEDIAVEFVFKRFPVLVQIVVKFAISLFMIVFSLLMVVHSIKLASTQTHIFIYTLKPITETYRTLAVTVGFALTIVFLLYNLWDQVDSIKTTKLPYIEKEKN